ncbi:2Fe-2S iron-sulfur cluster-binding protein [Paenibacillus larvae]
MKLYTIRFEPQGKVVEVRPGTSVLDAARKAGVVIRTRCGGKAGCLMCKIQVTKPSGLSKANDPEKRKLGSLADKGTRLSCQAKIIGNTEVIIPEDPLKAAVRAQLEKQRKEQEEDQW